jgi:hypothetical protein
VPILDLSRPPRPWSIEDAVGPPDAGPRLRLGQRSLRLVDVVGVEASSATELNYDGHMLAAGVFMGMGLVFLLGVVALLWHPRFLMGAVVFLAIGLMLVADIGQGHSMTVHRVRIRLADGGSLTFATAEIAEARGLVAALEARLGR